MFLYFTEAVAGVVGRADIGAAFFFITSLILYQDGTSDVNNHNGVIRNPGDISPRMIFFLSQLSAFCSTFTKEQGVTVLGVLIVYELLFVSRCNLAYPLETFKRVSILYYVEFFLNYEFKREENYNWY